MYTFIVYKVHVAYICSTHMHTKKTAKNINFKKSSLLLLGNLGFGSNDGAGNRVDAILKGYGLECVHMPKDGNCLFSSISFFIVHIQSADCSELHAKLREHLEMLGISPNQEYVVRDFRQSKKTCRERVSWSKHDGILFLSDIRQTNVL